MTFADLNIGDRFHLVNQKNEYEKLGDGRAYSYELSRAGYMKAMMAVEIVKAAEPPISK